MIVGTFCAMRRSLIAIALTAVRASTGKREAAQVFDYGNNVELPTVKVLPGNELTWRAAFGVDEGEPFVLTVDYAFGNETGIYQ